LHSDTERADAGAGELHISAISVHTYAYVAGDYALLPGEATMGNGYRPPGREKRQMLNIENLVLTLRTEIGYDCGMFQNRQRTLPGRFFVCADPSDTQKEQ